MRAAVEFSPSDQPIQAYLVGYSNRAARLKAFVAWPQCDSEPVDISHTMHVTPAPTGVEVTEPERAVWDTSGKDPLPDGKPLSPPTSTRRWAT